MKYLPFTLLVMTVIFSHASDIEDLDNTDIRVIAHSDDSEESNITDSDLVELCRSMGPLKKPLILSKSQQVSTE